MNPTDEITEVRRGGLAFPLVISVALGAFSVFCYWLSKQNPLILIEIFDYPELFNWVSPGYSFENYPLGKISQICRLTAVACIAPVLGYWVSRFCRVEERIGSSQGKKYEYFIALVGVAVVFIMVWFNGNRQFGAADGSLGVDLGWRLYTGQMPYADFVCTLPFGYYLASKFAFQLLGPYWDSLTVLTACFGAFCFLWSYLLLRSIGTGRTIAFALALYLQASTTGFHAFWWYNPIVIGASAVYILSSIALLSKPSSLKLAASYIISLALIASQKPNVAILLILGCTVCLLTDKRLWIRVLIFSGIATLADIALLLVNGISPLDVVKSYISIAPRVAPSNVSFSGYLVTDYMIVFYGAGLLLALIFIDILAFKKTFNRALSESPREAGILAISFLTALYSIAAHGEIKLMDAPLMVVPLVALTSRPGQSWQGSTFAKKFTLFALTALLVLLVFLGIERYRIEKTGFGAYFEWDYAAGTSDSDFFRALHSGPRFQSIMHDLHRIKSDNPEKTMFFGPRLQFAYAALHIPAPKGLPHFWHPATFHPESEEPLYFRRFEEARFSILIFAKNDYTYLPRPFLEIIDRDYIADYKYVGLFPDLSIFIRKPFTEGHKNGE